MPELTAELQNVADLITRFIEHDFFPAGICPSVLSEAVVAYPSRGGKRIRPALLLWTCAMFGGKIREAVPAAAAVEIYHNWTLVHDDIIDRDEIRRGAPAQHIMLRDYAKKNFPGISQANQEAFGTSFAILTGDIQQGWAIHALCSMLDLGVAPDLVLRLVRAMQSDLNRALISGEALDVEFEYRNPADVSEEDVLRMIDGKTGALVNFSVQTGAAIAHGRYEPHSDLYATLHDFSRDFARAFQLQDDLLGIYGEPKKFGKPIGSDFQEAKPTLLYLEAMKRLDEDGRARLNSMLRLPFYGEAEINTLRSLLSDCGAADAVRAKNDELVRSAVSILRTCPDNEWRDLLVEFSTKIMSRTV